MSHFVPPTIGAQEIVFTEGKLQSIIFDAYVAGDECGAGEVDECNDFINNVGSQARIERRADVHRGRERRAERLHPSTGDERGANGGQGRCMTVGRALLSKFWLVSSAQHQAIA